MISLLGKPGIEIETRTQKGEVTTQPQITDLFAATFSIGGISIPLWQFLAGTIVLLMLILIVIAFVTQIQRKNE
jgi:hypothetical protein